ncbi:predicted protein [Chaetoceros tenuissimus]|uniref:Uncharacterized protein n=1 Tax=Chaetoceros tenuissimus TaxID=426638 RepID=A0AAD3CZ66_9STRA|nr:predicted protein [Chaetoceros tenuissimus]
MLSRDPNECRREAEGSLRNIFKHKQQQKSRAKPRVEVKSSAKSPLASLWKGKQQKVRHVPTHVSEEEDSAKKIEGYSEQHPNHDELILWAKKNLLAVRVLRERTGAYIPDQDRAVVNEALRMRMDLDCLRTLIEEYPHALDCGGIVDHIDHPIHVACNHHRNAVKLLLELNPECANQRDANDKTPMELFLRNEDQLDITFDEFTETSSRFLKLDPTITSQRFLGRESVRNIVLQNELIPRQIENSLA